VARLAAFCPVTKLAGSRMILISVGAGDGVLFWSFKYTPVVPMPAVTSNPINHRLVSLIDLSPSSITKAKIIDPHVVAIKLDPWENLIARQRRPTRLARVLVDFFSSTFIVRARHVGHRPRVDFELCRATLEAAAGARLREAADKVDFGCASRLGGSRCAPLGDTRMWSIPVRCPPVVRKGENGSQRH
jgi:hypothetical protein